MIRRCRPTFLSPATLCLALVSFLCASATAQSDNGAIAGQITVARGSFPPDRIELTLETRGIVVNEVWTDDEGKFIFHDLPPNLYHVIVKDEKYEYYEEDVKVNPHTNPINILTIGLTPKTTARTDKSPAATGKGSSARRTARATTPSGTSKPR